MSATRQASAASPSQGTTSGAQSHPTNFNQGALALAGATAREALLTSASKQLGVAADQLTLKEGIISAKNDSTKKVSYGELVGSRKFGIGLNRSARRKHPSEWTVLGKPVPRFEIPAIVSAQHEYVQNVKVAGMLHGRSLSVQDQAAWLPIREEKSPPAPFDFAGDRIEWVPRTGDRVNEHLFRTRLQARLLRLTESKV